MLLLGNLFWQKKSGFSKIYAETGSTFECFVCAYSVGIRNFTKTEILFKMALGSGPKYLPKIKLYKM